MPSVARQQCGPTIVAVVQKAALSSDRSFSFRLAGTLRGTLGVEFGTLPRKIWTELTCLDGIPVERNSFARTSLAEYPREDSNL